MGAGSRKRVSFVAEYANSLPRLIPTNTYLRNTAGYLIILGSVIGEIRSLIRNDKPRNLIISN